MSDEPRQQSDVGAGDGDQGDAASPTGPGTPATEPTTGPGESVGVDLPADASDRPGAGLSDSADSRDAAGTRGPIRTHEPPRPTGLDGLTAPTGPDGLGSDGLDEPSRPLRPGGPATPGSPDRPATAAKGRKRRPKRTGWRRLLPTWRMLLGGFLLIVAAHRRRPRRRLPARRHPGGQRRRHRAVQRLPLLRRHPARPRRRGQPGERPARQVPKTVAARRARRRGPRLLLRVRGRPRGDAPRRLEHRDRQGQAVRFDHHPAVREELLPGPGTDRHPQGQGVLHRDQARPRGEQGRHPRGLPQHQLLRPQRLRHPGRRPGVLRQGRRRARPPPRAPTWPRCSTPPARTTSSPTPRTRPQAVGAAGTTSWTAWSRRTG